MPTADPCEFELRGDFWPEEEDINVFLAILRGWRGHTKTNHAVPPRPKSYTCTTHSGGTITLKTTDLLQLTQGKHTIYAVDFLSGV